MPVPAVVVVAEMAAVVGGVQRLRVLPARHSVFGLVGREMHSAALAFPMLRPYLGRLSLEVRSRLRFERRRVGGPEGC